MVQWVGVFRIRYFFLAALVCQACFAAPSTPVILISVDTLRADHLSCYQAGRRPTPHIDSLAKGGTLFSQVSTPFPLTLPAHTALLMSTYPFANGVEDNGIPLKPSATTLATVLKGAGYRTAAFVGSFVLDRRFGLDRGFDAYDGPLDVHTKASDTPVERKRPGSHVAQAAMQWLEHNSGAPFFLFLHLYDLHQPYDRPSNPALRHGETGYSAELAYEDGVIGDFLAFLEKRGLTQKALIVFTSDHGEGLGEHGESTHGYFIYQSTLHVPLMMHWPAGFGRMPRPRVDDPASLLDVTPTILDALGVSRPSEMKGRSLIAGGAAEVYSESLYARKHFGCAVLRSLRAGAYKYIETPKPELYDLASDPNELRNLFEQQRAKAGAMSSRIAAIRAAVPAATSQAAPPKPDTIARLRSLGYASGSSSSTRESTVDAKDRIADFERYYTALTLASAGRLAESDRLLRDVRTKAPDVVDVRVSLGMNLRRAGDYENAAREFGGAIEQDPSNAEAHFELGFCYFHLGKGDDAIREFKTALSLESWYTRADEALAELYIQKKDYAQARVHLNHLLSIDPASYAGHFNLGIFAAMESNWSEAEAQMQAALRADAGSLEAHSTLGNIYLQRGDLDRARQQFTEAIRLRPNFAPAHFGLGMVLQKQGKPDEAAAEFRAAQSAEGAHKP
jgi:choline-sulfatase